MCVYVAWHAGQKNQMKPQQFEMYQSINSGQCTSAIAGLVELLNVVVAITAVLDIMASAASSSAAAPPPPPPPATNGGSTPVAAPTAARVVAAEEAAAAAEQRRAALEADVAGRNAELAAAKAKVQ